MTDEEIRAALENAPVLFGLRQQGHVPTIEKMLQEGSSWETIGQAIGWCPVAAEKHYKRYVERKGGE